LLSVSHFHWVPYFQPDIRLLLLMFSCYVVDSSSFPFLFMRPRVFPPSSPKLILSFFFPKSGFKVYKRFLALALTQLASWLRLFHFCSWLFRHLGSCYFLLIPLATTWGQGFLPPTSLKLIISFLSKIWVQSVQKVPGSSSDSLGILAQALSYLFHLLLHEAKGFPPTSLKLILSFLSKIWVQSVQKGWLWLIRHLGSGSFLFVPPATTWGQGFPSN